MIVELEDCEVALRGGAEEVRMSCKPSYRLVICIDVEAGSLEEAYSKTYDKMHTIAEASFQWESSDEAFDHEGNEIPVGDLSKARMAKLNKGED